MLVDQREQSPPRTLVQKIWSDHLVSELGDGLDLIRMDRLVLHDRGGGTALSSLSQLGRRIRSPDGVFATVDHLADTFPGRTGATLVPAGSTFLETFRRGCLEHQIELIDLDDHRQGIVHVISPELGIALPGCTLACHDSHTCTIGGVGALGFGVGASEIEHALATDTLVLARPKSMRITLVGPLPRWTSSKDLALRVIAALSASGGVGYAVEFAGSATTRMSVEERLTLCNMSVEFGARTGVVAPDEATFAYLRGTPLAPRGASWQSAVEYWRGLASDEHALFDKDITLDCASLAPQVTWGTNPEQVNDVDAPIPDPQELSGELRSGAVRALQYMDMASGSKLEGTPIVGAFIGSCTNGRLSDLRAAANVLRGRAVAPGVRALCVPGSTRVKRLAEDAGLDRIFRDAGFEWREAGCSLCFNSGGDGFGPGQRVITSTNRNFENRQGAGARSHLASPVTVAASAVCGHITDVRKLGAME